MEVYEPDPLTEKLLGYLKTRNYSAGETVLKRELTVNTEQSILNGKVEKASSRPNAVSYSTVVSDLVLAEQQFLTLKNWIGELDDEQGQDELSPLLMPLLCHLYLDSLRLALRPSSIKFLKRLSAPLITAEWTPLLEQLFSLHTSQDIKSSPLVKAFRDSKVRVLLTPRSLALFRKCLSSKNLNVLLPSIQHWFDISIKTDDLFSSEEEESPGRTADEEMSDFEDRDYVSVNDLEMEELVREIRDKRLQPTPPPPLLLYTVHRTEGVVCGKVSEERKFAATGSQQSEVKIWGLSEVKLTPQLDPSFFASVPLAAFSEPPPDSVPNDKQMWSLRGHSDTVYDVAFLSESEYLISVSFDTSMRLWKLTDFSCAAVYRGHTSPIWGVAVSPIANYVATASNDKSARLWCLDRTYPIRIFAGHHQDVTCICFHPNGNYIGTGSTDKSVRIWSVTDGHLVRVFGSKGLQAVSAVAFSPNGQYIASGGEDMTVCLWDIAGGSLVCKLTGHSSRIISVDWSKDGSTLSASGFDGSVLLWSLDDQTTAGKQGIKPKKYITKCSTLLSLQYSAKSTLVGVGLD